MIITKISKDNGISFKLHEILNTLNTNDSFKQSLTELDKANWNKLLMTSDIQMPFDMNINGMDEQKSPQKIVPDIRPIMYNQNTYEMNWIIEDALLSSFQSAVVTQRFISKEFTMCGAIWQLECYPNGKDENRGYVALYLRCKYVHGTRIGVNYAISVNDKAHKTSGKWFSNNKAAGFPKIMKSYDLLSLSQLLFKVHIARTLIIDDSDSGVTWRFDKYFILFIKSFAADIKNKKSKYCIRSPEFEMLGGKFYLKLFLVSGKLVLHCDAGDAGKVHFYYKLSCAQFEYVLNSGRGYQWSSQSMSHNLTGYQNRLKTLRDLEIKCNLWTNRKIFNVELDNSYDLKLDKKVFEMYGMKFCLIYLNRTQRIKLLINGYGRRYYNYHRLIPGDVIDIITRNLGSSDGDIIGTSHNDFYITSSIDLKLAHFPANIRSLTIKRMFSTEDMSIEFGERDIVTFYNTNSDDIKPFNDTSQCFRLPALRNTRKYLGSVLLQIDIDIVSIKEKDHRIRYELNPVIREDAIYNLERLKSVSEVSFAEIANKNQLIIRGWDGNTKQLEVLYSVIDDEKDDENEADDKNEYAQNLWDEYTKCKNLLKQNENRSKSAESDIASFIVNQNRLSVKCFISSVL